MKIEYSAFVDIIAISRMEDGSKKAKTIFIDEFTFDEVKKESPFSDDQLKRISELLNDKKPVEAIIAAYCYGFAAGQLMDSTVNAPL